ncbi:MAG: SpoIIE family protein phosphatase [Bacteroidales bacterium]
MWKFSRILICAAFTLAPFFPAQTLTAQGGYPFIVNYSLYSVIDKHQTAIEQGPDNMMFFANPKGIITFDGDQWGFLAQDNSVYSLLFDSISEQLYAGGQNDFGFLRKDARGNYTYQSLSDKSLSGEIYNHIELTSDEVYFASEKSIVAFSRFGNKLVHQWQSVPENPFTGICRVGKKVFALVSKKGIFELSGDKMNLLKNTGIPQEARILFSFSFDAKNTMFGTTKNGLFLFDGTKAVPYGISDSTYLNGSVLQNGTNLSRTHFALGTLIGGCLVINKSTRKTDHTLNYNTGLPDDEVYALGRDRSSGLWISNSYGLSRLDIEMPVKNFGRYQGLNGSITSVLNFNGTLYVGTSEGVYRLAEVKEYSSQNVRVKINTEPKKSTTSAIKSATTATTATTAPETGNAKDQQNQVKSKSGKGFFARIFSSPVKKDEAQADLKKEEEIIKKQQLQFRNEKIYTLQSVTHKYEKISGISEKCKQLVAAEDRILVSTNSGLFEIANGKASPVLKDKYVLFISRSQVPGRFFVSTSEGLYSIISLNGDWEVEYHFTELPQTIYSAVETAPNELWLGSENTLYKVSTNALGALKDVRSFSIDSRYAEQVHVRFINQALYLFLSSGIYSFTQDSLVPLGTTTPDFFSVPVYLFSDGPEVWIRNNGYWESMCDSGLYNKTIDLFLNLFPEIQYISFDEDGNLWLIDNSNNLAKIDAEGIHRYSTDFNLFIKDIRNNQELLTSISGIEIRYEDLALEFRIVAPFYVKSSTTQYQYKLEGLRDSWSSWSSNPVISVPVLPAGKYTLHVRAKNIFGKVSEEKSISFRVKPPWWLSIWFLALVVAVMAVLVWFFIGVRTRKLQHDKKVLEQKVKERTAEIERQKDEIQTQNNELAERNEEILQQKEEIEAQRDEIEAQKNEMEIQRDQIALQNKEITDSIQYARRIQTAVLPSDQYLSGLLPESFVFFQPRDIVSGDFYWMTHRSGKTIVAAADCTGHGVPGAFMSMLGVSFLNEIVNAEGIVTPSEILFRLRDRIKTTLSRGGQEHETKDGMDIALCALDPATSTVEYAGAFNSLYLIRNKEFTEYKADKMPISIFESRALPYTNHSFRFQPNDVIYIFSDGYMDQFGGPAGRKLMSRQFKELLISNHLQPMQKQKLLLESFIRDWIGNNAQVDDMLIIGMRI